MELRDYIRILRKSWVMILLLALVAVAAASTYSILQTPKYSAVAKVFVSTQASGTTSDLAQGSSFTVQRVKTYSDLVGTPIVLSGFEVPPRTAPHLGAGPFGVWDAAASGCQRPRVGKRGAADRSMEQRPGRSQGPGMV
ncbi:MULTISPECIES: Wzz/FepE/Etk N-terminal domain-containing protein [unclassified Cryobacterium]|uniref:Wzz/FepE/Etk N-terminal domain-containing protein n=1 Tax=unclassified Cryobacterium TaxID=2649013 RepID=UPI002AB4ECE3|nr:MULTISPECIES: Wzz/FepE/Etk N-terminal domain-containing protein [unclassified Cryobacterium]MDY7542555.1 Wzz/FepE/Etk N-terminal domain-containing protein [Cryobacterium sp. 5B3]MEB0264676.1 Wzz/FepE/Etk N-terminal domain-containing protein [Cryobacterium sp. 10I5]MEB0275166.1 Wzz/FepE/Etk N-terminal domain-containing protein [Cryobacterium sp. 5B3]